MPELISEHTKSYLAGVLDLAGVIRTRTVKTGTELPYVALSGSHGPMLNLLGQLTGTRAIITHRSYLKAGCSEHCSDKHLHVESVSGRWSVSGVKATVLLYNLRPYLFFNEGLAADAINVGLAAPFKAGVLHKMDALGWFLPDELEQRLIIGANGAQTVR